MAMEKPENVVAAGQGPVPMKFSRYRSVRKAASQKPYQPPVTTLPSPPSASRPMLPDGAVAANGVNPATKRSMSRYRRQRAATESSPHALPQPLVPVPGDRVLAHRAKPQGDANGGVAQQRSRGSPDDARRAEGSKTATARRPENRRRAFNVDGATAVNPFLTDSEDEEVREKHRRDAMNRLTGEDRRPPGAAPQRRPTTRDRDVKKPEERYPRRDAEGVASRRASHEPKRLSNKEMAMPSRPTEKANKEVTAIDTSVGNHFPGIDAPVSAVNAGERRVVVQYRKTSLDLRVTPSTTAQDLLFLAAGCLEGQIDPPKFILMESFGELGLERPLRTYECIREVMNSWAHDQENTLIIVPAASLDALSSLDPRHAPAEPPADLTLLMYYSQRPRKWDKRYVTLRADGQITLSKKEQGQDQVNVCHLSDFDIYSPTSSYLSNNVKPPKKICQAIKSQQKSSMFLSTENFVHFFSTNDREAADSWYRAVQSWRSWYLVTKLGASSPEDKAEFLGDTGDALPGPKMPFKPLLNLDSPINSGAESSDIDRPKASKAKELFSMKKSTREHAPPPSSFPKMLSDDSDLSAAQSSDESPFASGGLLGRTYTQRQRAMKEREERDKKATEEPFTNGLIGGLDSRRQYPGPRSRSNSRPNSRSNTMTSMHAPDPSSLVRRSQSVKAKPLVDLTPVYQEPPQHTRKGRGVAVEPGVLLVDAATGPEAPGGIVIPSATTWRRPEIPSPAAAAAAVPDVRTRKRSNTTRSTSSQQRPQYSRTVPASPTTPVDPLQPREEMFFPNSLLARSAQVAAVSGMPKGHGVATGDRNATKPMLDLSPENPFAEGSLLRDL
ncbi:uncharacterized protein BDW43DRAFT_233076 [Aspergillus alliaceus]|uniref:uncharacterized protein n=1 Tax=Petromyces alliaceus TaxID=209559 RepID=UPI0012A566E0|nr:uncharacterized protein BDW43DRAFT_233076 [Aspergillus alliaceus]KAB8228017.1 hypothetical protein BDW43DRAFT_233076 [Aspergillus alliaceus]